MSKYDPFFTLAGSDDEENPGAAAMVEDRTEEPGIDDPIISIESDIVALGEKINEIGDEIKGTMTMDPEERKHALGAIRARKREILNQLQVKRQELVELKTLRDQEEEADKKEGSRHAPTEVDDLSAMMSDLKVTPEEIRAAQEGAITWARADEANDRMIAAMKAVSVKDEPAKDMPDDSRGSAICDELNTGPVEGETSNPTYWSANLCAGAAAGRSTTTEDDLLAQVGKILDEDLDDFEIGAAPAPGSTPAPAKTGSGDAFFNVGRKPGGSREF